MTALVKFALLRRREGLEPGQFSQHWSHRHARVLIRAGHREYNATYVQNHLSPLPGDGPLPFDGAAQMTQSDARNAERGFQEDPRYLARVRPDELLFMDIAASLALFTAPRAVVPAEAPGGHKLLAFVRRPERIAPAELAPRLDAWAQEALLEPAARRIVAGATHHEVVSHGQRGDGAGPGFDAVVEWRLPSAAALDAAADLLDGVLHRAGVAEDVLRAAAGEVVVY